MKHYFKTDHAFDERFLGIIEDSIYCNPNLSKADKDSLVTTLYELFYEADNLPGERYELGLLNPYKIPDHKDMHPEAS